MYLQVSNYISYICIFLRASHSLMHIKSFSSCSLVESISSHFCPLAKIDSKASWGTAAVRHSGHHCPRVKCGGRRNDKVVPHDNPRSLAVGRDVCLLFCCFVVSEPGTCGMPGGTNRGFLFSMSSDHHKTLPSAQKYVNDPRFNLYSYPLAHKPINRLLSGLLLL